MSDPKIVLAASIWSANDIDTDEPVRMTTTISYVDGQGSFDRARRQLRLPNVIRFAEPVEESTLARMGRMAREKKSRRPLFLMTALAAAMTTGWLLVLSGHFVH